MLDSVPLELSTAKATLGVEVTTSVNCKPLQVGNGLSGVVSWAKLSRMVPSTAAVGVLVIVTVALLPAAIVPKLKPRWNLQGIPLRLCGFHFGIGIVRT